MPLTILLTNLWFSPRKRRCFLRINSRKSSVAVFSAQAEVFPEHLYLHDYTWSFLRASGGVSHLLVGLILRLLFSPRKRRCFCSPTLALSPMKVFSAQAEVFLNRFQSHRRTLSFLRASGGVSSIGSLPFQLVQFSPRKRRCFLFLGIVLRHYIVFSAQAEVFPSISNHIATYTSFLRASGGVSMAAIESSSKTMFSPRKRRCF